jgi:hypothetical protein
VAVSYFDIIFQHLPLRTGRNMRKPRSVSGRISNFTLELRNMKWKLVNFLFTLCEMVTLYNVRWEGYYKIRFEMDLE